MKNFRNIAKVFFTAAMATMCIKSSAFAADNFTSVKNTTALVNEEGYIGQMVIGTSNTTVITGEEIDRYIGVFNTEIALKEDSIIDFLVKFGEDTTAMTNKRKHNKMTAKNIKEIYNKEGFIGTLLYLSGLNGNIDVYSE